MLFAKPLGNGARLDDGVRFEGIAVFDDVACKANVLERLEFLILGPEDVGEVPDFTRVSRSYYKQVFHLKKPFV